MKTADQFSRLPWYEQIKYIPVAGALCSTGFQELTDKQLETYKNSKVTAAIRYKPQPANNDYAVKVQNKVAELKYMRSETDDFELASNIDFTIKHLNTLLT